MTTKEAVNDEFPTLEECKCVNRPRRPLEKVGAMNAIALAERYCDSCLSHSADERMTMFRFTMWVREQPH